jgi:hypothetical protein
MQRQANAGRLDVVHENVAHANPGVKKQDMKNRKVANFMKPALNTPRQLS